LEEVGGILRGTDPDAAVTSRITRVVAVVDAEGFPAKPHEVGHFGTVDATGVIDVLIGDVEIPGGRRQSLATRREFSLKGDNPVSVEIDVCSLSLTTICRSFDGRADAV
jgi:hypothetical protein